MFLMHYYIAIRFEHACIISCVLGAAGGFLPPAGKTKQQNSLLRFASPERHIACSSESSPRLHS